MSALRRTQAVPVAWEGFGGVSCEPLSDAVKSICDELLAAQNRIIIVERTDVSNSLLFMAPLHASDG